MAKEITNPFSVPKFPMTSLEKVLKNGAEDSKVADASPSMDNDVIMRGVLSVTILSAEDLPGMDLLGKTNPFVVLNLKKSGARDKTRVVKKSLNPTWNKAFDFVVEDAPHELLILEVYDRNTFGKELIGKCIKTLTRVLMEGEYCATMPLQDTSLESSVCISSGPPNQHIETHKHRQNSRSRVEFHSSDRYFSIITCSKRKVTPFFMCITPPCQAHFQNFPRQ